MSKYDLDLDYAIPKIDISKEELNEIIAEADSIIAENSANPEKLAVAYLKKGQCLFKLIHMLAYIHDYFDKEKLYKAKELLEKALELTPDMPEALMRLGTVYSCISKYEGGYFDEAMTMLTRAIQLKPNYAAAFNNRSNVYSSKKYSHYKNENHQDNLRKAIADLSEAMRIRPFDATYYLNRGIKYSELGEHEKAFCDFTDAIKYGSDEFKDNTNILSQYKEAFRHMPENLKTQEMCLETVKQNGEALEYVPENLKTAEMCFGVIKQDSRGFTLKYVPENLKTAEMCLEAVKKDIRGFTLKYVPENLKTAEMCFEAVKNICLALEYVPENLRTAEMCFEAIKKNGWTLQWAPENLKTVEMCFEAVRQNGLALKWVPENLKTAAICLDAVRQNGRALKWAPENIKTMEICYLNAINQDGAALEFIPENLKTVEICFEAVKQNGWALEYVPENLKTAEMCFEAVKKSGGALQYVPENLKTAQICLEMEKHKKASGEMEGFDEDDIKELLSSDF